MEAFKKFFSRANKAPFLVAEVAQSHEGSLGMAHAFIEAVSKTGANAIKFQTHMAEAESSPLEPFRVRFSTQDQTRFEYWKRMEFSESQWLELKKHAEEKNLLFLSSPFSEEAVHLLEKIGILGWKIGSGEVNNLPLIKTILKTKKPVLISSGFSSWEELDHTVTLIEQAKVPHAIFQTTSLYPTPPEKLGLNLIPEMLQRYSAPIGLSDHSGKIFPSLSAYSLGATLFEVHVCLSKEMFGPDVSSSLTTLELKELAAGLQFLYQAATHPVEKDSMAKELESTKKIFEKSVFTKFDLPKGHILTVNDLVAKKPGTGIPAKNISKLFGNTLKNNVSSREPLRWDDMETSS